MDVYTQYDQCDTGYETVSMWNAYSFIIFCFCFNALIVSVLYTYKQYLFIKAKLYHSKLIDYK